MVAKPKAEEPPPLIRRIETVFRTHAPNPAEGADGADDELPF